MPIFVEEVVISVEVTNQSAPGSPAVATPAPAEDRQAVIAECVERVLDILREREER